MLSKKKYEALELLLLGHFDSKNEKEQKKMNISKLREDELVGLGVFSSLRRDKKNENKHYLEVEKLGSKLTLAVLDKDLSTKFRSLGSSQQLRAGDTLISYSAKVSVMSRSQNYTKDGKEGSFVSGYLGQPILIDFEIIKDF